jgi:hypothetical protein
LAGDDTRRRSGLDRDRYGRTVARAARNVVHVNAGVDDERLLPLHLARFPEAERLFEATRGGVGRKRHSTWRRAEIRRPELPRSSALSAATRSGRRFGRTSAPYAVELDRIDDVRAFV